ncbi:APC family permease [candidate division WWE3 bacterium]|uniref:APC family permease n=1 Tax=candidate division WWE3 bacterium TaxID=2053526 RepID=A0A955DZM2_UNCKA|nr:APC family permease [candidate division WWE3 bacterium]
MNCKDEDKLNQLSATAICGNDILSSVLYVSGIATMFSGIFAPLVLLVIGIVLFFYKSVYIEIVEALPINGGAYNCLLNGASKSVAAVAGAMTILSYIATAVISAKVGVEYLHSMVTIPIIPATVLLLGLFAALVISGIKDSAKVALVIFITHIVVLTSLSLSGIFYMLTHDTQLNYNIFQTTQLIAQKGSILPLLFLAFSASLLGISGFESSANFVEEQKRGVFRKTLRNMLLGVAIFNPLMAFVVIQAMPYEAIVSAKDFLLSDLALITGGRLLQAAVVIDAFLVLSGAVLTSFVGVSGLVYRMASDSCLPNFLTKRNAKGTYYRIIIAFFLLCSSILVLTGGDLLSLAGVYTISFLGVMSLFAFGNLILRQTRTDLKRTYSAPLPFVLLAFLFTAVGMAGNILIDAKNFQFFEYYFLPTLVIILIVIYQDYLFRALLHLTSGVPMINNYLNKKFSDMVAGKFVVFIKHSTQIHSVLTYINKNETGREIYIAHCYQKDDPASVADLEEIRATIPYLQKAGVYSHLNITLYPVNMRFGPKAIQRVSKELSIRENRIMVGSIHDCHPFDYDDMGGVRIIF